MELLRYLLRNIVRRPLRAIFVLAAGFISSLVLVFAFALGTRVNDHIRMDTIAKWSGHLWVSAKEGFQFDEDGMESYARQSGALAGYFAANPNTAACVPWYMDYYEMQAGTAREYVNVAVTDLEKDLPYRERTELTAGRFPEPGEQYAAVITTALAREYRLEAGDSIILFIPSAYGARNAMDFTVTGIERASAPWYDSTVTIRAADYVTLSELGEAFPFYKVYVKDERGIPQMVRDAAALAPEFSVKGYRDEEFVRFLLSLGMTDVLFFGLMAMIIFLALLIGIRSIILTNIFDRRDEIGTLRALGFSRSAVRNLFFGESLASLLAGYLLGAAAVAGLGAYFDSRIVRPPLLMLQYMFGMTRVGITVDAASLALPFLLLFLVLFLTTFRTVGKETEKQAVAQMANR